MANSAQSGSGSATASGVTLSSFGSLLQGVWISVPAGGAAAVEVLGGSGTTGPRVAVGDQVFFPCEDSSDITVKRTGGSDETFYFWAY